MKKLHLKQNETGTWIKLKFIITQDGAVPILLNKPQCEELNINWLSETKCIFWPENNNYYGLEYENAPYYPRQHIINVTVKQNNDEIIEVRLLPPEARSTKVLPMSAFLNYDKKKIEKGYMAIASLRSPHDKSYDDLIIQNSIMCTGKPIMIRIGNQFRKSRIFIPSLQHYRLKCYPRSVEIEDVRQLNLVNNKILILNQVRKLPTVFHTF